MNYPIYTHILIRNIEPHIYETPAYQVCFRSTAVSSNKRIIVTYHDHINDCWCAAQPRNYRAPS